MQIAFVPFDQAVSQLPTVSANPMWDKRTVNRWLALMEPYRSVYGLVDRYVDDLHRSEVGVVGGLPYVQQVSAYISDPSVWLLDGCYCAGLLFDHPTLMYAAGTAATRWKTTVDVPAVFNLPGDMESKICRFDQPFKSKQRNEQKQALAVHTNYRISPVTEIPFDFMCASLDYWCDLGSPCDSALSAYCWTAACAEHGFGHLLHFESDLGQAYIGIVDIGGQYIFNIFFQGLNRPPRVGTASLTAAKDWMLAQGHVDKYMYLAAPRYGEDLAYAVYKSHLANDVVSVGSMFAYYPPTMNRPHYNEEHKQWTR